MRRVESESGFTLTELVVSLAVLGILVAIAIVILLGVLEQRRVDAAAKQFASDMRLAHTNATNQLTDWRVVFMPDGSPLADCSGAVDYCLVRLASPYGTGDSNPEVAGLVGRDLPEGTKIKSVTFAPDCSAGDADAVVLPSRCMATGEGGAVVEGGTRTLEYSSNGTVRTLRPGQSGTVKISSDDGDPYRDVVFLAATSNVEVK